MSLAEKGIIIRRTVESDLRNIYLTVSGTAEFSSGDLTADRLADLFMSDSSVLYSAVRKKHLLGFILGNVQGGNAFVEKIFVKEKFRRCGIGSLLLEKFSLHSKKAGSKNFFIALPAENMETLNFFIKRGFVQSQNTLNLHKKNS
ncbi:MAG TPA: GNAT family N-acetyltransferase [Spirochaetota bacterium]|nr:GNAT family N-acetyltransferase [Spirochaetota bacterium]